MVLIEIFAQHVRLTCFPLPIPLSVSCFISGQIFVFFVCVTVAAVNAQWFGQLTSEIMADMHMIEQACGLGQDIGLSSNREAYSKLCDKDPKYKQLSNRLWLYHLLSSLCNLCCIVCNGYSLYYLAENLTTLWFSIRFTHLICLYAENVVFRLSLRFPYLFVLFVVV